jgi:hypothetical protein
VALSAHESLAGTITLALKLVLAGGIIAWSKIFGHLSRLSANVSAPVETRLTCSRPGTPISNGLTGSIAVPATLALTLYRRVSVAEGVTSNTASSRQAVE